MKKNKKKNWLCSLIILSVNYKNIDYYRYKYWLYLLLIQENQFTKLKLYFKKIIINKISDIFDTLTQNILFIKWFISVDTILK
jgi:hypothetical protein